MNKSKIEWVRSPDGTAGYTWNPVSGCLGPNNDGVHSWHPERLAQPAKIKKPSRIFVGPMTDMGAPWVKREWMDAVLDVVRDCPHHTFMFLTKQPNGFAEYAWPTNVWLGTTVTRQANVERIHDLAYFLPPTRSIFASFEPLLAAATSDVLVFLSWAIIGAQSGPGTVAPKREWIAGLLECLDYYKVPVFMKDNLRPHWDGEWRQEWPA